MIQIKFVDRDENVFLKGDRALSKLITLLISNKKEFNHFFKSRSSDIVLLKLGNLNQNAKRYEARNTERKARSSHMSKREARRPLGRLPQARSFLRAKRAMRMCERSEQIFKKKVIVFLVLKMIIHFLYANIVSA